MKKLKLSYTHNLESQDQLLDQSCDIHIFKSMVGLHEKVDDPSQDSFAHYLLIFVSKNGGN